MTIASAKKDRQMPKGGRKGGSVFPRITLNDAIGYARKLVSKTHTSAQPIDVIFSGVVGAKGGKGAVRISALRQYGFLKGDKKSNFSADDLAKKIVAAPHEELLPLYRQAILKPAVFKKLFDTYNGDTVSKSKLRQRAADLKVHPEETATCVELYVSDMTTAGLVTVDGDQVKHLASSDFTGVPAASSQGEEAFETTDGELENEEPTDAENNVGEAADTGASGIRDNEKVAKAQKPIGTAQTGPRAVFNVNVTLDSSLDIEKLQKQLELLKRFGAI